MRMMCGRCHGDGNSYCSVCNGFGWILEQKFCRGCGVEIWDWPDRGRPIFDGMRHVSFNGVQMVYHSDGWHCGDCPAVSLKQFKFMQAVKNGAIKAPGLSKAKAAEYVDGQSPKGLPKKKKEKKR